MTIALPTRWIWDSWYVRDGDLWHAFFLQADKSLGDPDLRHFNVTQGHATSRDLKVWDYRGTSFAPAQGPALFPEDRRCSDSSRRRTNSSRWP